MNDTIDEVLKKAPPECATPAEKIAFAFGWFKAIEQIEAAVLAERERCAKYAENFMARYEGAPMGIGEEIRDMI